MKKGTIVLGLEAPNSKYTPLDGRTITRSASNSEIFDKLAKVLPSAIVEEVTTYTSDPPIKGLIRKYDNKYVYAEAVGGKIHIYHSTSLFGTYTDINTNCACSSSNTQCFLIHGGGKIVLVASYGDYKYINYIYVSNSINGPWTAASFPASSIWDLRYGSQLEYVENLGFRIIGMTNRGTGIYQIIYSTDGITWNTSNWSLDNNYERNVVINYNHLLFAKASGTGITVSYGSKTSLTGYKTTSISFGNSNLKISNYVLINNEFYIFAGDTSRNYFIGKMVFGDGFNSVITSYSIKVNVDSGPYMSNPTNFIDSTYGASTLIPTGQSCFVGNRYDQGSRKIKIINVDGINNIAMEDAASADIPSYDVAQYIVIDGSNVYYSKSGKWYKRVTNKLMLPVLIELRGIPGFIKML